MECRPYPKNPHYLVYTNGDIYGWYKGKNRRRMLKPDIGNSGYKTVHIKINGKVVNKSVANIVAETFLKNPFNNSWVMHLDGDKLNNNVDNLYWATPKQCHTDDVTSKVIKGKIAKRNERRRKLMQIRDLCNELLKEM